MFRKIILIISIPLITSCSTHSSYGEYKILKIIEKNIEEFNPGNKKKILNIIDKNYVCQYPYGIKRCADFTKNQVVYFYSIDSNFTFDKSKPTKLCRYTVLHGGTLKINKCRENKKNLGDYSDQDWRLFSNYQKLQIKKLNHAWQDYKFTILQK